MAEVFDPEAFRAEVRTFCAQAFPDDLRAKAATYAYYTKEDRLRWQRILNDRGWFAAHWPTAYGGADWGPLKRFIFIEETEYAGTPWLTHFGVSFVGPVIYTFGTEAQRARYLPDIRESKTWWCQGFSEPAAGSDLAAVQTRAVREGDHYIVNGQKTWTTMAHWADMMFALVRTSSDGPRQGGISFLLIDLRSPGVSIRPIATIDGHHHVNDVFFDNVRVPVENLVGHEGDGWRCAKFIVSNERVLVTELGKARRLFEELERLAHKRMQTARSAASRAGIARRLAALGVKLESLRALAYQAVAEAEAARPPGIEASILKIRGSELQQALLEEIVDVIGSGGLMASADDAPDLCAGLVSEHLYARATSIYGGSNEIQSNIIVRAVLAP